MKNLIRLALAFSSLFFIVNTAWAESVEVALADRLGDTSNSNYCIDIPGGQERADPTRELRVYTCYTYQGIVGFDHAMDSQAIANGKFHLTGFDVCMQANEAAEGSTIVARDCDDSNSLQKFNLLSDTTIRLDSADELCLSVGEEVSYGRNGPGGHENRGLTLEPCSQERSAYQQWYTRTASK
ncbi:MAG: RICIN domain-containing protein [Acidiferrobacterales bacterium]|nr:RICIN domain-containing protein [Acidiferrobacterales bacterium]